MGLNKPKTISRYCPFKITLYFIEIHSRGKIYVKNYRFMLIFCTGSLLWGLRQADVCRGTGTHLDVSRGTGTQLDVCRGTGTQLDVSRGTGTQLDVSRGTGTQLNIYCISFKNIFRIQNMMHVFNYGINYLKWIHVLRQKLSITRVCQQMSKLIFELSYYLLRLKRVS